MYIEDKIYIGKSGDEKIVIEPKMANRHGLIAGATGTGKTITLKVLAESFSDCGVSVFLADAKGDLAGMCHEGENNENMQKRITKFGLENFTYTSYPTCFWDVYEKDGHCLRTTISEMGPMLLSRLMDLNNTQEDILSIIFKIADDSGLLLIDTKDLRSLLQYVGEHVKDYIVKYGNMTTQSIGTIVREVIALEEAGGDMFFGEPALDIKDWFAKDSNNKGYINILACDKLMNSPKMYGTFMLWMMSELFEILPEAGDADKPKMVFFFDEAHMLFRDAPKALIEKIEQVVKLIRSKGVGIYFITQSPSDIPGEVLSQLGNRIQHALRAYTPAEQKALKAAAESFRVNPDFKTIDVLTDLGIGEALISVLDEDGRPSVVKRSFVLPPQSRMGAITPEERKACMDTGNMAAKYDTSLDRDSAYEFLNRKTQEEAAEVQREQQLSIEEKQKEAQAKIQEKAEAAKEKELEKAEAAREKELARKEAMLEKEAAKQETMREKKAAAKSSKVSSAVGKMASSAMSTIGREVGKNFMRGIFKNLKFFK